MTITASEPHRPTSGPTVMLRHFVEGLPELSELEVTVQSDRSDGPSAAIGLQGRPWPYVDFVLFRCGPECDEVWRMGGEWERVTSDNGVVFDVRKDKENGFQVIAMVEDERVVNIVIEASAHDAPPLAELLPGVNPETVIDWTQIIIDTIDW